MRTFVNSETGAEFTVGDETADEQIVTKARQADQDRRSDMLQARSARDAARTQDPMGIVMGAVTPEGQEVTNEAAQMPAPAPAPAQPPMGEVLEGPVAPEGQQVEKPAMESLYERAAQTYGVPVETTRESTARVMGGMGAAAGAGPAIAGARLGAALVKGRGFLKTIGGSLGGLLGEAGAQKAGLIPESGLGLAGAALPIPVSAATRQVVTHLPGAAKGVKKAAAPLWEAAEQMATRAGVTVQPIEVFVAAAKLAPEALSKFATGGMKRLIKQGTALGAEAAVPFKAFRDEIVNLGRRVRSLGKQGGPEYGQAKTLLKAMHEDLNAAISRAPAELKPILQEANKLSRRAGRLEKVEGKIGRTGVAIAARGILGGALLGPKGLAVALSPDVVAAVLETKAGQNLVGRMVREGASHDQIVNAVVQLARQSVPREEEYQEPWER